MRELLLSFVMVVAACASEDPAPSTGQLAVARANQALSPYGVYVHAGGEPDFTDIELGPVPSLSGGLGAPSLGGGADLSAPLPGGTGDSWVTGSSLADALCDFLSGVCDYVARCEGFGASECQEIVSECRTELGTELIAAGPLYAVPWSVLAYLGCAGDWIRNAPCTGDEDTLLASFAASCPVPPGLRTPFQDGSSQQ